MRGASRGMLLLSRFRAGKVIPLAARGAIAYSLKSSNALSPKRTGSARARSGRTIARDARSQRDGPAFPGYIRCRKSPPGTRRSACALPRTTRDHPPRISAGDGAASRSGVAHAFESAGDGARAEAAGETEKRKEIRKGQARQKSPRENQAWTWRSRCSIFSAKNSLSR
jgi:hypothetical protein